MKRSLQDIKAPIAAELEAFEKHFRDSVRSRVALLDKIMHYIVHRKGKQMRPIFVLLSAKMCGDITPKTYTAASNSFSSWLIKLVIVLGIVASLLAV